MVVYNVGHLEGLGRGCIGNAVVGVGYQTRLTREDEVLYHVTKGCRSPCSNLQIQFHISEKCLDIAHEHIIKNNKLVQIKSYKKVVIKKTYI